MKTILTDSSAFENTPVFMYLWYEYPVNKVIVNGDYIAGYQVLLHKGKRICITDSPLLWDMLRSNIIRFNPRLVDHNTSDIAEETLTKYMKFIS